MALFEKLKKLFGVKEKVSIQNNFLQYDKDTAIKEFEANENTMSFVESYENLQGFGNEVAGFYTSKFIDDCTYVICEKMLSKTGEPVDGYPRYKILTKDEAGNYSYKVISYQDEINYTNVNIEKCIKLEYSDNKGFNSQYIYKSELEEGNYENKEMITKCLDIIAKVKEQTLKAHTNDLQK